MIAIFFKMLHFSY